jgi:hypothetical protein
MGGDLQGLRSPATRACSASLVGCDDAPELIVEKRLENCSNAKNPRKSSAFRHLSNARFNELLKPMIPSKISPRHCRGQTPGLLDFDVPLP